MSSDNSLIVPSSFRINSYGMYLVEDRGLSNWRPRLTNSLYFSLLTGNLIGEELAQDCVLRHSAHRWETT